MTGTSDPSPEPRRDEAASRHEHWRAELAAIEITRRVITTSSLLAPLLGGVVGLALGALGVAWQLRLASALLITFGIAIGVANRHGHEWRKLAAGLAMAAALLEWPLMLFAAHYISLATGLASPGPD